MLHVHVHFNNNVVSLITTHTKHWLHVKISVQKVKGSKAGKNNGRTVTKISSCQVNTTSRRGIKPARNFFWFYFSSIFL